MPCLRNNCRSLLRDLETHHRLILKHSLCLLAVVFIAFVTDIANATSILVSPLNVGGCLPGEQPCNGILNAFCDKWGRCLCKPGYAASLDRCVAIEGGVVTGKVLGDQCTNSYECSLQDPGAICANRLCQCAENYIKIDNHCRPVLGSDCSGESTPCPGLLNSICKSGRCVCNNGFIAEYDFCKEAPETGLLSYCDKEAVTPCGGIINTQCHNSLCQCLPGYIPIFHRCYPGLGQNCSQAVACGITNSICTPSEGVVRTCQCKIGYFEQDGECVPGIGSPCFRSKLGGGCPHVPNAYCNMSSLCDCQEDYQQIGQNCVFMAKTTSACQSSGDCQAGKVCINGKCKCPPQFVARSGYCFAAVGGYCKPDATEASLICGEPNSVCVKNKCLLYAK